jgi:N-acetylneuraminate synthase
MNQTIHRNVFDELFVLELANNHWGRLDRGFQIIREFGRVVRYNSVRAAIKLQFRDVDRFIHKDFRDRSDIRYIKKTMDTRLKREDYFELTEEISRNGCLRMATPFDEASVELCEELGIEIIKLASSDINDWILIEAIAKTRRPVIASSGGSSLRDLDDLVTFFSRRNIPLALNHCVSLYPSQDGELELNQIDFLRNRFPGLTIGFSTHECGDWSSSVMMAYAKGARTFERHIDIEEGGIPVAPYCSLPHQVDEWFKAFLKAKEMCGAPGTQKRTPPEREVKYLDALVRGVYAARDLPEGHLLLPSDYYLAVPLQKGQISCRELFNEDRLLAPLKAHEPITLEHLDNEYGRNPQLRALIQDRGL